MTFEIKDRDAAGRICKFTTKHGVITTPNLLPVINPNKMIITPKEMKQLFGTEIIITNSYIINKNPELKQTALEEGVHKLLDFDGPIMTDSGTFQSYVYGDIDLDPIEIVKLQRDIGSDIGTILDVFGTPELTKKEAEQGVKETINRARKSIREKGDMLLACTVQGSIYPKLRKRCASELSNINSDFFPIGGVVPLMENQRYVDMVRCILSSKQGLDPSKPVHLFGAGHPLIFPLAVALPCCCPVCSKFTASQLKKLEKDEVVLQLAKHNLYVSFAEIKKIRAAISQGCLWELVERRAYSNPSLIQALKELRKTENKKWLEQFDPISKDKALFYTGDHTIHRPLIYRCHTRLLNRYEQHFDTTIIFPEGKKPYSAYYSQNIDKILKKQNVNVVIHSNLGPVPIELDEMYPFAQSVVPANTDVETEEISREIVDEFLKEKNVILWEDRKAITKLASSKEYKIDLDLMRISAVADLQFGKGTASKLFNGKVKIIKSKKTGKIRNVYCNGKHILSMRAGDGLFTLKIQGAYILHNSFNIPTLRVTVAKDAVPFIREGKSVFAKFVIDCDPSLRPLDECLIVNEEDDLLGVGRTLLNRAEMISFKYGVAVKTRETIK